METQLNTQAYVVYLPVALLMTFLTARVLFKNSKIFMTDIFNGREVIALATNRLFEVGFYLLNVGAAFLILKISQSLESPRDVFELLSLKLGGFSIYLGIMLFFNLFLFFRGKRKTAKINALRAKQQA